MKKAIVLLKVEPGEEDNVFDELGKMDFVFDEKLVFGDYDIVATIKYEKESDLEDLILNKIGKVNGVKSTATLIIAREK
ncbi:MAG: Lrp/AsnC ligand binding domain-containing protein [Candidatus Njordarchaeia archaeon]